MLKKNDEIVISIEDYTSEGGGIGRHNGLAVFIPETAVGDTVLCHIIKVKKNYAIGKLKEIITPSKDRQQNDCPAYPRCGGCSFRHITYEAELNYKQKRVEDAFLRIGGISLLPEKIIAAKDIYNYRNKAQYPVKLEGGEIKIGFYSQRSHRIIDTTHCALHPDDFSKAVEIFREFLNNSPNTIYDEKTRKGLVRHLYLRKAFAANELMVCPVINGENLNNADILIEMLKKIPSFKTLILNINKEDTNTVLGKECITLYGDGYITDELCSLKLRLSPLAFYQVNPRQTEVLYQKVKDLANCKPTDTVVDLYCGTGTIGLMLAKDIKQLIGVEIVPDAVKDAEENTKQNGIKNVRFLCGDAEKAAKTLENEGIRPNTIIID
ncbi:MAG TPA: 23S rRNA (uracil(1939)-C(5))-methyltransferase RlmD, partial [Clostridia bacterium]|nr:23S rRNA (uracil(1939)-C(5))-methyltransferase RlmD [Clostridia bacterium]